jgi:O-antigen/teichoic acid export membrane protein
VLLNVTLNAILIPRFGACGAAAASLATQIFANFIFGFIFKPIRGNNRLLVAALNPKMLISESRKIIVMLKKKAKTT